MTVRHPIRGLFGGLVLGLGAGMLAVFLGAAVLGTWTVLGLILVFGLIGLLYALVMPPKRSGPR
ncbi:MAG: hypothetical protein IT341_03360 [Chloroflexi bacterium]|nr:hypothetical protein [Chloroflexota bacterium]